MNEGRNEDMNEILEGVNERMNEGQIKPYRNEWICVRMMERSHESLNEKINVIVDMKLYDERLVF